MTSEPIETPDIIMESTRPETPVARISLERVRRNLDRVVEHLARYDLRWRPHVKTHKSPQLASLQLEAGATGLTVATPREAEVMATVCDDLLLAHPPVGSKADRLMRLPESVNLSVALDSTEALDHLARAATRAGRSVAILIELGVGMGRVGVQTPEACVHLAERVSALDSVRFEGVLFYPGHIRTRGEERQDQIARTSERLAEFLRELRTHGLEPGVVSGGSTPTLWDSQHFSEITEVRAGTCIFHDRDMVELGICDVEDVAYWIDATVVSTARAGQVVVDAGSKALSKEVFRGGSEGFGVLLDAPHVMVRALSEEHGIIELPSDDGGSAVPSWSVGDRVRIIPNHVCVSVNLQDRLVPVDADTELLLPARGRGVFRPDPDAPYLSSALRTEFPRPDPGAHI